MATVSSYGLLAAGAVGFAPTPAPPSCKDWPQTCPGVVPRAPYKQTWMMNLSTIIMYVYALFEIICDVRVSYHTYLNTRVSYILSPQHTS